MSIDNWIMIFSALIVAAGWFVTGHLNRKNEIAKERRKYRLDMLHSYFKIIFSLPEYSKKPTESLKLPELLEEARRKFVFYGYEDEISDYISFRTMDPKNIEASIKHANKLSETLRQRIRDELGLNIQHPFKRLKSKWLKLLFSNSE